MKIIARTYLLEKLYRPGSTEVNLISHRLPTFGAELFGVLNAVIGEIQRPR